MKKRILSLLLILSMAFCLLLPISAFAVTQSRGDDCFAFLKSYLMKNGKNSGVYTYCGTEKRDDASFDITVVYNPNSDQLRFSVSKTQEQSSYRAEVTVPSALKMPYDAVQYLSVNDFHVTNAGKIGSDFTTQSQIPLSGETYDTEKLFPYAVALALRHTQDKLLYGSGYTIADLGFTALFEELYGSHKHESVVKNAKAATGTEPGYTGDEICAVCGQMLKKGEVIPAGTTKKCDGGKDCPSRNFTDVDRSADCWYHASVDWAVTTGVTTGKTSTSFAPGESCTRGQMVTFLWRAKGSPEPKSTNNPFVDVPAGEYYTKAVLWALENGITTGMDGTHFAPNNTVTRAQTVTFLWRLMQQPAPKGGQSFPDVPAGQYYAKAVMWAVENGVTNGMGNGLFAPNNNCTRAQIVTFLYRTVVK